MTNGVGIVTRSERSIASAASTISAFSLSSNTTARRTDTTLSGS
jgi:hypothetical protein